MKGPFNSNQLEYFTRQCPSQPSHPRVYPYWSIRIQTRPILIRWLSCVRKHHHLRWEVCGWSSPFFIQNTPKWKNLKLFFILYKGFLGTSRSTLVGFVKRSALFPFYPGWFSTCGFISQKSGDFHQPFRLMINQKLVKVYVMFNATMGDFLYVKHLKQIFCYMSHLTRRVHMFFRRQGSSNYHKLPILQESNNINVWQFGAICPMHCLGWCHTNEVEV